MTTQTANKRASTDPLVPSASAKHRRVTTEATNPNNGNPAPLQQGYNMHPIDVLQYDQLVSGQLTARYKRFLGDVILAPGDAPEVIYVPNTGPMTGLLDHLPSNALMSYSDGSSRKYAHTLEWIQEKPGGTWVGVHSAKANAMVATLLRESAIPELLPYESIKTEVKYGSEKSRVDFVLEKEGLSRRYVEVKSVTLADDDPATGQRLAVFPDTVSVRAQKHVRELIAMVKAGHQAAMVYVVQRDDCQAFAPCYEKDPVYADLVRQADEAGVVIVAAVCALDLGGQVVKFVGRLPLRLDFKRPAS